MRNAIFLDRDGVLNQTIFRNGKARAPYTSEEFSLYPGVEEAITLLQESNYLLIVVTNQPDVARGWVTREAVEMVNNKIRDLIHLDDIKICFHTDNDNCQCRKPRPGMLLEAMGQWDIDSNQSFMIGDRYSDIEAGKMAGCKTILIGEGDNVAEIKPDFQKKSLLEAARMIVGLT